MKIKKNIQYIYIYIYQKNGVKKKTIGLLLIVQEGKRHDFLIKYFNTFMYDH